MFWRGFAWRDWRVDAILAVRGMCGSGTAESDERLEYEDIRMVAAAKSGRRENF